ncbi:hypothetical protein SRABI106_02882 [Rahnella aquatilis]|nr:hypothetical protein SRABI106_02882 [Rahnella aquatilis]
MVQISAGFDERATRLGHFCAVDGDITVHKQVGRLAETAAFQHGRPEQAVEINDVFTNKVIQLGGGIFFPELVKIQVSAAVAQVFE